MSFKDVLGLRLCVSSWRWLYAQSSRSTYVERRTWHRCTNAVFDRVRSQLCFRVACYYVCAP